MNAKEARRRLVRLRQIIEPTLSKDFCEALTTANIALCHEQKMERIADLEATPEKVTLTLEDILYINNEAQVFERLLHHLPDSIVDHIGFICDAEMKDRYARREKMEKECEA